MARNQEKKVHRMPERVAEPLLFIGPQRLRRLARDVQVQVDASAVCVYLHCRWKVLQNKKKAVELARQFFDLKESDSRIRYGSSVCMTISELIEVFGKLDSVPIGAVRGASCLSSEGGAYDNK